MNPGSLQMQAPANTVHEARLLQFRRVREDDAAAAYPPSPSLATQCANCMMHWVCIAGAVPSSRHQDLERMVQTWRRVRKGEALFRAGDPFHALYSVRSGSFKTVVSHPNGTEHVTGFQLTGETLGMDGIAQNQHTCDAIALEDSTVCAMSFQCMEALCQDVPPLQHRLHQLLAGEIVRESGLMLLLAGLSADARVATFLLNLSSRLHERGYSATDFTLRMTREEIGSYLGMQLETVSRTLSRFQREGWIRVEGKHITLYDREALAGL
ncbi:helix-turn-helix domain-containing protein [Ralstonia solanacearum]|uniref:helix-turn-helix domain-containing protein n=1 Tax=Ralstonia solanacearum TaxID=305 RepID=UPI00078B49F5|nr:helix-turn-helix domain-containing protein [Ralstonia solanacearum]AMP37338.1 Crp/Fnr family transcriptional regulator [Ralstonia solanacearum]AXV86159.1 Crp/Fnr family transcriptional regulator [Ralstonia solanacearum]AXW05667.1 Crp/Fnr family transcriptional regulator [Ralstonia solanacearum]AXW23408.1 Crp/Fnr family transcriptional regulator [Ralstonia solanacearum]AXW80340.1 Crp/Fnr family transcriptional regulator [Ralstonia solanacearum]